MVWKEAACAVSLSLARWLAAASSNGAVGALNMNSRQQAAGLQLPQLISPANSMWLSLPC